MSFQDDFMKWLSADEMAEDATMTSVTGTTCPCTEQGRGEYDPQWHVDNPGEDDCSGDVLISSTTSTKNIKAIFYSVGLGISNIPLSKEYLDKIGEIQKDDLIMIGTVDVDEGVYISLSSKSEYSDYITKDSVKYLIRDVGPVPAGVGQVAHLVPRIT